MNAILARILNRSIQRDLMDRGLVKNAQALGTAPRLISLLLDIPHDVHYSPGYSPHHLTSCGPQKPTSSPPSPSATASPWQPLFFSQPLIDFFFFHSYISWRLAPSMTASHPTGVKALQGEDVALCHVLIFFLFPPQRKWEGRWK